MSTIADPREPGTNAIVELLSEVEVLDGNVLHELHESLLQPPAVAALYRRFIGNAAAFICELRVQESHARSDTLHTLKGSAEMMGARRLATLATHLQAQLQCSSVQVAQATGQLEGELVRFRAAAAARLLELGAALDQ